MSVWSPETAVVSLGLSCQGSHQLNKQVRLLKRLTRDRRLRQTSFPFDWVIAPAAAIAGALTARECIPGSAEELVVHGNVPWWPRRNLWYWHDFKGVTVGERFDEVYEKYERRFQRLAGLKSVERRVFVVSNTQSNLALDIVNMEGRVDYMLGLHDLEQLIDAIDALYGDTFSEFCVVTSADRLRSAISRPRVKVHEIGPDTTDWEGSPTEWARALHEYFGR